ncbi:hypothetical protein [uncultured Algibacter sp.]|uniref:hypothetical protein n=1 Tax=uncultured Algibacter sp. TaxID=298659 RepID=UPI00261A7DE7|nr:hypothetical protein [uncultured Algibacter sp.]
MKTYCILFLSFIILSSCKTDKEQSNEENSLSINKVKSSKSESNLNISILLDLSDRINPKKHPNPAMEFYQRDLGYIHSIVESFEWHLRNKRTIKINDHIQLYIDPEPSDSSLNKKINSLNISFTRDNAKKDVILQTSVLYDSITKMIYKSAIEDDHYVGSNIWGFFKTNVEDFCIEKDHRNILVVLTDGYLFHKDAKLKEKNLTSYLTPQVIRNLNLNNSNWKDIMNTNNYGFIPTRDNLNELEILVLGINPYTTNPYEQDVVFEYWNDWLTNMKVKNFEIKMANLPANMDKIIKDFILIK